MPLPPGSAQPGPPGRPGPPGPLEPDPDRPPRPTFLPDARAGAVTAVLVVLLGAPVGLLWAALAPRVEVVQEPRGPALVDPEAGAFIAADVTFLGLVLLTGAVLGTLGWLLGRRHGPGVVLGLLLGGLLAAWIAAWTGEQTGRAAFEQALTRLQPGDVVDAAVRLRAPEAIVFWPVGSLLAFAALTWLTPNDPVSSG